MKSFVAWLALPLGALLVTLWFELRTPVSDGVDASALSAIDDPKLARTVLTFGAGLGAGVDSVRLTIDDRKLEALRSGSTKRMSVAIAFDQSVAQEAVIKARGNSRHAHRRKSLSVELSHGIQFGESPLPRFLLLSLASDPHRFEMYTCYRLLARVGLFPSRFRFVTLHINDKVEGTYLLLERPEDAIRRQWPEVSTIARLRRDGVELVYTRIPDPYALVRTLRRPDATLAPDAELRSLDRAIDLDHYLRWLAFNSLVENADSRDELFLFELPGSSGEGRLDLVPWDYDDLQQPPARPTRVIDEPLFYASEMPLDHRIHENALLWERYRRELRRLLEHDLTIDVLSTTLAETAIELRRLEVDAPDENHDGREYAMKQFEARLVERRQELLALSR